MRSYLRLWTVLRVAGALVATLLLCEAASADWPADGVPLCGACDARNALIASDGAGGAFVVWTDARNSPTGTNDDIFLQRVTATGAIAPGWLGDGLAVCLGPRSQLTEDVHSIAPDGFGGVIVAWRDYRNQAPGGTGADVYAQRILADATIAPGWPADGSALTRALGDQSFPSVAPDGAGGAFFTWHDDQSLDIYAQHLTGTGAIAPGWVPNGLPICTLPSAQGAPQAIPDGFGGMFIAWGDLRDGPMAQYAQRITASGQVFAGWPENGARIVANRYMRDLVSDGAGGAYLSCATAASLYDANYYLQRLTGAGTIASGWPDGGALVCQAPDERVGLRMEPDGAGGALLVWSDYRDHNDDDVYALRMRSDGTRDPNWPANGLAVTNNTALDDYADLAADGQGGGYLCWAQYSNSTDHVLIQHLTGTANVAPTWPPGGLVVPSDVVSAVPHITADGVGGAIVSWCDRFGHLRALRVTQDVPVAVDLSTASAVVESGGVHLRWYGSGMASLVASVERRTETTDWEPLASVTADGTGWLAYEDRAVMPGTRYGYRLAYHLSDELRHTDEAWVEIPALQFALRGLTPNPSMGDPVVTFSLANSDPATLQVYDLHGRLVQSQEVGSLGPGSHEVRLSEHGRLPTGIYAVRLHQGERVAVARAVIIR